MTLDAFGIVTLDAFGIVTLDAFGIVTPDAIGVVGGHDYRPRSRLAATLEDRPWIWTKPLALDWSKLSPSS